ncbi:MAG: N-acetylneuraminate synthase [Candidatus Thermoplasmatota archaeon]|nr:N-acetylneuraminate synthase [Candidatus Thermoplasmatota archaeon]
MNSIKIGTSTIGVNEPCFIIAEAGINHNGDIRLAKRLVDHAAEAGADAVKFQTFTPENMVTSSAGLVPYQKKGAQVKKTQVDLLKRVTLTDTEFISLKTYCDQKKIIFLSTPHSFDAIDFLEKLVPAYKFGSGDVTNIPALTYAAKKGKPMILGTGMSTLDEVKRAVTAIQSEGNNRIVALHCTTNYPCPLHGVNLQAMVTMKEELDCLIGYSDHTAGILVPALAVALGACVIEKHLTLDKSLPGPDHTASLEPQELAEMICEIRNVEKALGSREKKPTASEKSMMEFVRKSIVAERDIAKGTVLTKEMLAIKRPGTGMAPELLQTIIGKRTVKSIAKDEVIQPEMIA